MTRSCYSSIPQTPQYGSLFSLYVHYLHTMGYNLTRQTNWGQGRTEMHERGGSAFDRIKTVVLGKESSQFTAGQKGICGSHCPGAFMEGSPSLGWEGNVSMEL